MKWRFLPALFLLMPVAAEACTAPKWTAQHLKTIPTSGMNQALFSEALRLEASYARCKNGNVGALADEPKLGRIAASQSIAMAKSRKLTHGSFASRVRTTGLSYRTAAENIAAYNRFQFPAGEFKILNASACRFAYANGKAVPAHSYASLAQAVVQGWLGSSGHRKNLLNRRMKIAGGGVAYDPTAPHCGRFFVTQDYAG
jgi:uncharacterized protein YkwD